MRIEMTGKRFGRLLVVAESGRMRSRQIRWKCVCDCGSIHFTEGNALRSGRTQSCGCRKIDGKHGRSRSLEYRIWQAMRQRCSNPRNTHYKNYGGRGIRVCKSWAGSFVAFYSDMGPRPNGTSIDRIDNDGGYSPSNCRWASKAEQGVNMRSNRLLTVDGETLTVVEWAARTGIGEGAIRSRIQRGWSDRDAVTFDVGTRYKNGLS